MEQRFNALNAHTEGREVSGYVALWDKISNVQGVGKEAFAKDSLLFNEPVSLYWQHDRRNVLGSSKAKTLTLENRPDGLFAKAVLPKSATREIEAIKRGDIQGFSAGMVVADDDWSSGHRTINKARLFELSLVDKPAHKGTEVKLRNQNPKPHWTNLILEYKL